jgi:cell division protein FtsB
MSGRINITLAIVCIVTLVTMSAVWFAHGQTANVPEGFQAPLVRDLDLIAQVQTLTARVDTLEAKVKDMQDKLDKIKTK